MHKSLLFHVLAEQKRRGGAYTIWLFVPETGDATSLL